MKTTDFFLFLRQCFAELQQHAAAGFTARIPPFYCNDAVKTTDFWTLRQCFAELQQHAAAGFTARIPQFYGTDAVKTTDF